jgi:hypothetical protein
VDGGAPWVTRPVQSGDTAAAAARWTTVTSSSDAARVDPREALTRLRPKQRNVDDTVRLRTPAMDTLQVPAHADHWLELMHTLTETAVPPAPGDSRAMRHVAKLDHDTLDAVLRWLRAANRPTGPTGAGPDHPLSR